MDRDEVKSRLDALVVEIQEIYRILDSDGPFLPREATEKLEAGICLRCGKPITSRQRAAAQRGNHSACYRANKRAIDNGKTTDRALIEQGLWAPKKTPGRKPIAARKPLKPDSPDPEAS